MYTITVTDELNPTLADIGRALQNVSDGSDDAHKLTEFNGFFHTEKYQQLIESVILKLRTAVDLYALTGISTVSVELTEIEIQVFGLLMQAGEEWKK